MRWIAFSRERWHVIKESHMQGLTRPCVKNKQMGFLDEVGAFSLHAALNQISWHWRMFFITAMIGGLLRGENVALEWKYFNFEERYIHVVQAFPYSKTKSLLLKKQRQEKKGASTCRLYIAKMEVFYKEWEKEKELLGDHWKGEGRQFLFP